MDVGAGEGELLAAADAALRAWGVREQFRLVGVERSAKRRERSPLRGAPAPPGFPHSKKSLLPVSGLIVAYELFDALPVRALFFDGEKLLERVVTLGPGGEGFAWGLADCAGRRRAARDGFETRGIHLRRNQKLEVRPAAHSSRVGVGRAPFVRPPPRLRLRRARESALFGRACERDARGVRRATTSRATSCPEPGSRDLTAWVDFHRARGGVHGRGPRRRGAREPVARPRLGGDLRGPRDRRRRSSRRRARGGPPRRRSSRPAGWNGGVDSRPPRVPGHGSRVDAGLLAAAQMMPLHRLTSPGSAHRILTVLTEARRHAGAVGPRGMCS